MLIFEIAAEIVLLFAFFYGAIKLWKKGKPLYFQIIIAAVGCYTLYQLAVIVMMFCDIAVETYFNDGLFGLFGCYLLLFSANRGTLEKLFDRPKTKSVIVSALAGVLTLIISGVIAYLYFDGIKPIFFIFILLSLPACFVVYFNVKHLLTPVDDLGMIKGLRLTDIFSIAFCLVSLLDIAAWINVGVLSGISDFVLSFVALALVFSAIRGAQKWNY